MKTLLILGVLAVLQISNGAIPPAHRPRPPAAPARHRPPLTLPTTPKTKPVPTVKPATAAAKAAAKATATAPPKKNDQYLQSLSKITTFMVKLNSFLELTIGTITRQLTDLTTQMAEVRGSLDNLVTSANSTTNAINAKPPPVPDLPAIVTTPAPRPAPRPAPKPAPRPAPRQAPRPTHVARPAQPMMRRPVQQPMRRMQPVQQYAYPQQLKPTAPKQMSVVPTVRKPVYYPRGRDQALRWPGNNEFHPWWQKWWSNNFQGFYPDKRGATQPAVPSARPQFGNTAQQFGNNGQKFGASASQFGTAGTQFGTAGTQYGSQFGENAFNPTTQFGAGMSPFSGNQFGNFGSMSGGMGGGSHMWQMQNSNKGEAGETEGKGV